MAEVYLDLDLSFVTEWLDLGYPGVMLLVLPLLLGTNLLLLLLLLLF